MLRVVIAKKVILKASKLYMNWLNEKGKNHMKITELLTKTIYMVAQQIVLMSK